jgi:hypothetical protein
MATNLGKNLGSIIGILRNFVESTKFGLIWLSHFLLEQIDNQADGNALHFVLQCAEYASVTVLHN